MKNIIIILLCAGLAAVTATVVVKSLGAESAGAIGGGVGGAVGAVVGSSRSKKKK